MEAEAVPERDKGKGKAEVEETDQQSLPEQSAPTVDTSQNRDKYAKAKIEEPNLQLPKALLKPNFDPNDGLCYLKIFEDDDRKAQHLAEAVAEGAQVDRKVYRIRNKELVKVLGEDFKGLKEIHRVSKSMIGLLADNESNIHSHTFLDLVGTVEQVRTAEELILDKILKTYDSLLFPVILMPPTIYQHYMKIPDHKIVSVLGLYRSNIKTMEMVSGVWIQVDGERTPVGSEWETGVNIYGPKENVMNATSIIESAMSEPWGSGEAGSNLQQEFEEPSSNEIFHGKKSSSAAAATGESSVFKKPADRIPEKKKQQVEEATTTSGREGKYHHLLPSEEDLRG